MKLPEQKYVDAAENFDWMQVHLNGSPPCFHFEEDRQRFCGRAKRWEGHKLMHEFVSLAMLIQLTAQEDQPLPAWDQGPCEECGTTWKANEVLPCPVCAEDAQSNPKVDGGT